MPGLEKILLTGPGHTNPDHTSVGVNNNERYLYLGNGIKNLTEEDFSSAKEFSNINSIHIWAHGKAIDGAHHINIKDNEYTRTADIFQKLHDGKTPIRIELLSCYAGAASKDIVILPCGSTLITHGTPTDPSFTSMNRKRLLRGNVRDPFIKFTHDLVNSPETHTISYKRNDGSIWQHTARPPSEPLQNIEEIQRYLNDSIQKYIEALKNVPEIYNEVQEKLTNVLKTINEQRFSVYRDEANLLYLFRHNNEDEVRSFFSNINNNNINLEGDEYFSILKYAAMSDKTHFIKSIMKKEGSGYLKKNIGGTTVLHIAADTGTKETVRFLIYDKDGPRINPNIQDDMSNTPLMDAVAASNLENSTELLKSLHHNLKAVVRSSHNPQITEKINQSREFKQITKAVVGSAREISGEGRLTPMSKNSNNKLEQVLGSVYHQIVTTYDFNIDNLKSDLGIANHTNLGENQNIRNIATHVAANLILRDAKGTHLPGTKSYTVNKEVDNLFSDRNSLRIKATDPFSQNQATRSDSVSKAMDTKTSIQESLSLPEADRYDQISSPFQDRQASQSRSAD